VSENRVLRRIFNLRVRKWREGGEDYRMRSVMTSTLHQYYSGDKMKVDEAGGAYSTRGRDEKCIQYLGCET
jgi:hypothetical protein